MQTVRRLYLYLMSGISLGVLLVGLIILLSTVFHAAGLGPGRVSGGEPDRQALSLAAALIVVGLLVWAVHWLLVERSLRPDNPRHDEERAARRARPLPDAGAGGVARLRRAGRHRAAGASDNQDLRLSARE